VYRLSRTNHIRHKREPGSRCARSASSAPHGDRDEDSGKKEVQHKLCVCSVFTAGPSEGCEMAEEATRWVLQHGLQRWVASRSSSDRPTGQRDRDQLG
jgi:hypothetical protein